MSHISRMLGQRAQRIVSNILRDMQTDQKKIPFDIQEKQAALKRLSRVDTECADGTFDRCRAMHTPASDPGALFWELAVAEAKYKPVLYLFGALSDLVKLLKEYTSKFEEDDLKEKYFGQIQILENRLKKL